MQAIRTSGNDGKPASSTFGKLCSLTMRSGSKRILPVLALALLLGLGGLLVWFLKEEPLNPSATLPPPVIVTEPESNTANTNAVRLEALDLPIVQGESTVAFPLELELELVEARDRLRADGMPPQGSAATARLKGSVLFTLDRPVAAQIRFEKGPNEGRILRCDASGRFGASDLYPGLALVSIRGPGIPGALRTVRLRQGNEEQLNLSYARLCEVSGRVVTREDLPIEGAEIRFDGQRTESDANGHFRFEGVAPGKVVVIVQKPGFASVMEELSVPAMGRIEAARLKYSLEKGARLTIELPDPVRTDAQAMLVIVPARNLGASGNSLRSYPWFSINPIRCYPGGTVQVEDLPPGELSLRCFHVGARAKPTQVSTRLDPGGEQTVRFGLEPAAVIQGVVRMNGEPVQNAEVLIEAADRLSASLAALGEPMNLLYLESEIFPDLAPALQTTRTDAQGRFELTNWESMAKERYLIARYEGGRKQAFVALRGGETKVDLNLEAAGGGSGLLRLPLPGRSQGLPYRVTISGEPRGVAMLAVGRDLVIPGLAHGRWKLSARWNGEVLANGEALEIGGETEFPLILPAGALEGQDADTRARAGLPR